jgi:integrase
MFLLMANKRKTSKKSKFTHCRVTLTSHPKAPWRVSFPIEIDGKTVRKRRMFSTQDRADGFAEEHEKDVSDYGVRFGSITAEARRAFDSYRDAKADLGKAGIEVPSFEMLVAGAIANLRREHEERLKARVTVAEAVEGFLGYKKTRVGKGRLSGLKGHCGRFSELYGTTPLDRVAGAEIESWLFALKGKKTGADLDAVTRNKMRKDLKELFAYGLDPERGWCHRNPLASIKLETEIAKPPKAYSVADSGAILQAALDLKSPALPVIVLGLFSGLRPSETMAIDLAAINLHKEQFRTPDLKPDGTKTKTGTRMSTLTPAAAVWFALQDRRSGLAWLGKEHDLKDEINRVFTTAKVKRIFDGFRHSYITYRVAQIRDVARVADECGNSPNVIKKHYREIVPTEAGTKFFALRPEKTGRKSA